MSSTNAHKPLEYSLKPDSWLQVGDARIAEFHAGANDNIDPVTVASFGEEWKKFSGFSQTEIENIGNEYFDVVEEKMLNKNSRALDVGCGSGRWTRYVATRAAFVEAIDPSEAVMSAQALTGDLDNVRVSRAGVDNIPFADESFDFVFSLGVLHHIPDTAQALATSVKKLKPGGYFLVYLYYALDNRGPLYKALFHASASVRWVVSKLPSALKKLVCDVIAVVTYLPFVLLSKTVKAITPGDTYKKVPLSYYEDKTWNVIRNDALDRFGTPLEQRFTQKQVEEMMRAAGLTDIVFSPKMPCWHAVGRKE